MMGIEEADDAAEEQDGSWTQRVELWPTPEQARGRACQLLFHAPVRQVKARRTSSGECAVIYSVAKSYLDELAKRGKPL